MKEIVKALITKILYKSFLPRIYKLTFFRFSVYPVLLLFIYLSLFMSGCSEEKVQPSVDKSLTEKELPSQEGWDSQLNFTEEGKLRAILYYRHMTMYEDRKETLLEGVKIDFYNQNEIHSSTLTSLKGRVDDKSKNMWAIDSVVCVNDSGVILTTDELMWRHKDKKIVSDKFVTIISPKEKIQGYGFESDQNLRNYVIYKITYITSVNNTKKKQN
jgi:LPS export ABC transporter protein LptC